MGLSGSALPARELALKRESEVLDRLLESSLENEDLDGAIDFAEALGRLLADRFHAQSELPGFEGRVQRILEGLETARRRPSRAPVPPASRRRLVHAIADVEDVRGHANACWNLVRGLSSRRPQVLLIPDRSHERYRNRRLETLLAGCPEVELYAPAGRDRAERLLRAADWVDAHASAVVWHANAVDLDLWLLARMVRRPVVYVHHPPPYTHLAFGRWDAEVHVDIRGSNAELCAGRAPEQWTGKIVSIENGVRDLGRSSCSRDAGTGRPLDGPYLLSVASGYKLFQGPDRSTFLEQVVRTLLRRHAELRYVLLGHHSESLDSFRSALEPHIAERVHFMGQIDDTATWYRHALGYLNPFPMGTGLALLEALSAGLPVVSLAQSEDHPAYVEALDADQVVKDEREYTALASAFVADEALRERVGRRNREVYERWYRLAAVAQRWQRLLDGLETAPPQRPSPEQQRAWRDGRKRHAILRDDRPPFQPGLAVSEVLLRRWLRSPLRPSAWNGLRHLRGGALVRLAARQIDRRRRRTRTG